MATIEELLSANLPVVPSLPFRTAQPTTKPEIQAARAELEPYQRAGESGRQQSQMIAEALRTRQRQIGEQAASAREKGLLEIEAKRPIPKELPAFDAPKKTFDELFSVIMVGAMTAAGAGKGNYLAAANSMIGAMEGYQKGKKTEFDQALREFDTSLKKALQEEKVNNAKYQQIAASDKLSLAEKVRQIQIQATALDDKIMSATARSNDFEKMTREIARRNEGFAKIEDARNKAEEELKRDRQRAADRASLAAATREAGRLAGRTAQTWEVTDEQGKKRNISVMPQYDRQGRQTNEPAGGVLLGTGARAGAAAGGEKPGAPDVREYRALKKADKIYERLSDSLGDEDFSKRLDQLGIKKALLEPPATEGLVGFLARRVSNAQADAIAKKDQKMLNFLQDITLVRNTYYRATSGLAVTGGEAARNFFATVQPTDSAATLRTKIDTTRKDIADEIKEMERLYRFPSAPGETPSSTSPSAPAAPATEPAARKVMPGEEKLREYANQHFGGNVENARKYLKSLGYE